MSSNLIHRWFLPGVLLSGFVLSLLAGCTERRRADAPVPDGDTIEVVIPAKTHGPEQPIIIESTQDA